MLPRWRAAALASLVVCLLAATGCLPPAKVTGRCRGTGLATEHGWILQCQKGKWTRTVSVQQAVELMMLSKRPAPAMSGPPIRVLVAGDSTGNVWGASLWRYAARFPQIVQVKDVGWPGCPITRTSFTRNLPDEWMKTTHCTSWESTLAGDVRTFRPDVSIVVESMMEQADQMPLDGSGWRNVLDPTWAEYQLRTYHEYADLLSSGGAPILWADVPVMKFYVPWMPWLSDNPARTAALNANYRRLDAARTDVELLGLAALIDRPGGAIDWYTRPDGVHISDAAADILTANWLIPLLIQRYRSTPPPAPTTVAPPTTAPPATAPPTTTAPTTTTSTTTTTTTSTTTTI